MKQKEKHGTLAVTTDFLERFLADRFASISRPLEEYQALYPGYEAEIAEAWARATGEEVPDSEAAEDAGDASLEKVVPGQHFGPYLVGRELGRGGQGIVFLATDTRLGGRRVALKVLFGLSLMSSAPLKRFRREAEIAAKLDHPSICTVYETGVEQGVPFIAMRYLEGETLTWILNQRREAVKHGRRPGSPDQEEMDEILDIVLQVADGLHEAHEAGVIHRDIKPGNIMVTPQGRPYILDFGLGREVENLQETITGTGVSCGTPAYMSPEQRCVEKTDLDRRSDVFSLGVVLFEALTLSRPFDEATAVGLKKDIHLPPPRNPRRLNPGIDRGLKAVLETALAADRRERYPSARALAEDLRRLRARTPVLARSAGLGRRFRRWVRRSPVVAGFTLSILVLLLTGLLIFALLYAEAEEARRNAVWQEYVARITAASGMLDSGRIHEGRYNLETCPPEYIGWEHRHLCLLADTSLRSLSPSNRPIRCLALPPGGETILSVTGDGALTAYDARTYAVIEDRICPAIPGNVIAAAASPGDEWIVTSHRDKKTKTETVRVWNISSPDPVHKLHWKAKRITRLAVSSDGSNVLIASSDSRCLHLWKPEENHGHTLTKVNLKCRRIDCLQFSPGRSLAALAGRKKTGRGSVIWFLDTVSGKVTGPLDEDLHYVQTLVFSRDGLRLFTAATSFIDPDMGKIHIWDTTCFAQLASCLNPHGKITCLAVHPDDSRVFTGHEDGKIRVLDGALRKWSNVLPGHEDAITALRCGPGGILLHAGEARGGLKVWNTRLGAGSYFLDTAPGIVQSIAFDPSGDILASSTRQDNIKILDIPGARIRSVHPCPIHSLVAFARDGRSLYFGGEYSKRPVNRFDLEGDVTRPLLSEALTGDVGKITFDPDRERVLCYRKSTKRVEIFSCRDQTAVGALDGLKKSPAFLAVSQNGNRVAALTQDPGIVFWTLPHSTGQGLEMPEGKVLCLAVSPDGSHLAAGYSRGHIWMVNLEGDRTPVSLPPFEGKIKSLAFEPEGRRLAVAFQNKVSIVDIRTGTVLLGLGPLQRKVWTLAFSPDGRRLAAGCLNGGVHVWNTPGARRRDPDTPADSVTDQAYALLERLHAKHVNLDEVVRALKARQVSVDPKAKERALSLARDQLRRSKRRRTELSLGGLLMRPGCPAAWYEWALEITEKKLAAETNKIRTANLLTNKAQALYHLGQYQKSLSCADRACNILCKEVSDLRGYNASLFKALCLLRTRKRPEALKIYPGCEEWLKAHGSEKPSDAMYHLHARRIARKPGRTEAEYGEARDWARCSSGPGKNPTHRITLGLCLYRLKRYEEALKVVDSAAGCHGSDPTLASATCVAVSCFCHHALGNETRARFHYSHLLVRRNSFELRNDPEVIGLFREAKRALNR